MSLRSTQIDRRLGFIIGDISRLARREFERRARALKLTRAQWLFLYHLARQPGCTQSELAESLQQERITISRQAERLERAGWIERRDRASDRRAYHLFLTNKAERMTRRLDQLALRLREDYLAGLPAGRRHALIDDLLHIKTNLLRMEQRAKLCPDEN
ncbi:MAG: MarR family transcriptional regulator [Verrucomicrobia bacterium]|nr:MarR family transcriptional regulator [Verrucomicrobiota bacterium]